MFEDMDRVLPLFTSSRRPMLLCGNPGSGRTAVASFVARSHRGLVTVIDPTSTSYLDASRFTPIIPEAFATDAAFYVAATEAVQGALSATDGLLVIDDFDLLAEPYSDPLPEQREFMVAVAETVARAANQGLLVVVVDRKVPDAPLHLDMFGPKVLMGRPHASVRRAIWPGFVPVDLESEPGHGVLVLDGRIEGIRVPQARAA